VTPVTYAQLGLRSLVAVVNVWRTTYHHPLHGVEGIVEWFKGSGLRPLLQPLDESERAGFLARYAAAFETAYPAFPDGTVLLPFPRLFFVATR
jgi:trans-aconitate 2-methyltransferase